MKKTEWYPDDIFPVRIGVYKTKHVDINKGYSYWDGSCWHNQFPDPERAIFSYCLGAIQNKQWRGLASNPE